MPTYENALTKGSETAPAAPSRANTRATDVHRRGLRALATVAAEAAVATAVAIVLAGLLAPAGLGLGVLSPHPVWLAALVVAARYGGRGLAVGVPVAWGGLAVAALAVRVAPNVVLGRLSTGGDLGALVAVVLVSWMASMHERRLAQTADKLAGLERRSAADQVALSALRRAAVVLRTRADRLHTSLAFLRDVAGRLGSDDADAAAQAALDLATVRLGARAAVVHLHTETVEGPVLTPFAFTGVWAPAGLPDVSGGNGDRTAAAVLRARRPIRAVDLPEGGPDDSDMAAPILGDNGELHGILAVRGVPQGGANAAALRELAIIASWAAGAIAGRRREPRAVGHQDGAGASPTPAPVPSFDFELDAAAEAVDRDGSASASDDGVAAVAVAVPRTISRGPR
jgi:hypothetical protein